MGPVHAVGGAMAGRRVHGCPPGVAPHVAPAGHVVWVCMACTWLALTAAAGDVEAFTSEREGTMRKMAEQEQKMRKAERKKREAAEMDAASVADSLRMTQSQCWVRTTHRDDVANRRFFSVCPSWLRTVCSVCNR